MCHVVPQHEGRTQSIHVCAHKQQYIAVEAKKHFLWEDEIHPFKIPEYPYILECIQV